MTTPDNAQAGLIGPPRRPSDDELAAMPTVRIPAGQRPTAPPRRRRAPLVVAAVVNTLWAALLSVGAVIILVLLARISLGQRPSGPEVPIALAGWLLAHGVPLQTGIGRLSLAPLSIALLAVWRLSRAGVHTARGIGARDTGSLWLAAKVALAIGVVYGLLGLAAALTIRRPDIGLTPWRATLACFAVGSIAALLGSLRTTGALRVIARAIPVIVRDGVRTGVVAALLLLGAGAGLTGLAIAISGREATQIFDAYPSGLAGQAGVTLVCLAFAPNMAAWAVAYLLGPGFIVGTDTVVQPVGLTVGEMPALPVLAALPSGALHGPLWLLMAMPAVTGVVANLLMVRRRLRPRRTRSGDTIVPVPHWVRMFGSAGVGGIVAGILCGAMVFAASGRLDGGRPFPIGAVPWQVALFATVAIGLGGALGIAGAYVRNRQ
ncbi:DUF6350 family protein [Allorhizocola rhizosphaerae]|uniref:cell division protein PerM n=1 Tax=Allorhizocola rhizosphaerae TaxID=1872709 RepID=UPI000E3C8D34|nr:DUF6350 family protein [Allorhizocola rhizosphaerae]